jgi:hypothetical protein
MASLRQHTLQKATYRVDIKKSEGLADVWKLFQLSSIPPQPLMVLSRPDAGHKERQRELSQSLAYEHQSLFIPSGGFYISLLFRDRDEVMGHLHTDCGDREKRRTWESWGQPENHREDTGSSCRLQILEKGESHMGTLFFRLLHKATH